MSRISSFSGGFELRMRARISSLAGLASGIRLPLALAPPMAKTLFWDRTQIARLGPAPQHAGQFADHAFVHEGPLSKACHALRRLQPAGFGKYVAHGLHSQVFRIQLAAQVFAFFAHDLAAKLNQHLRDIDLSRANLV